MKKSLLAYFQTLYFKRGFFLIFSAFFCLFAAICALVLLVYAAVTLRQFEHDVESFSDVAVGHAEEIMAQATRVLDVFDKNTFRSCSSEHMELLRRASYSNDYVQDVIYIEDNQPRCSLMISDINRSPLLSSDLIYKNKYQVWYNADNTLKISPDSFIPMARQVGLMKELTIFVINEALQTASVLKKSYPEMFVSINLEAAEFEDMSVFNYLMEQIAVHNLAGANVNVELTESSMIEPQKAAPMVGLYQQKGVDVAIDDFGTGYSGLSYLERVKANKLKIDKSFVGNINNHSPTDIVLSHIVSMAHCLNLHIVAEGVETPIQEAYLKSLGVAYAQGWLYSKALTQDTLLAFLAARGETLSDR
ncbi:EAL domain-containing protein [Pectobacterium aroidearum]|uniref:EAL domain-containing protein n=1 Tax=Pectobacterium aroidearum TaxID=1201031 RepID=UPI0031583583